MTNLHHLVPAVLLFVGQSTACVKWTIVNPPIIFGKRAELSCLTVKSNTSSNTHLATSWLGGKNYSILTFTGGTADPTKYAEIRKYYTRKFESILQIYKFDEKDVNVDYSCSVDGCESRKRLSLAPDKFEYHPDKNTTYALASLRNSHLNVIVKISKVYPIPKCTIMFNEKIISRRLTTKIDVNGIFYKVEEEAEHYIDACSGQLIVTCVVGKTNIPIHQESFNRCIKTKEESTKYNNSLIFSISAVVLLCTILVTGMSCLANYGKLKKVLTCTVSLRGEERLEKNTAAVVRQLLAEDKEGGTDDAGPNESHEMMPLTDDKHI